MGKAQITIKVAGNQKLTKETPTAFDRLQAFAGIVDSGGLQLSTETGKRFREVLQRKSAGESKRS